LWAAVEAKKFVVATMPHKGAGLQFITDFDCQTLLGMERSDSKKIIAIAKRFS
jgi:hypothetical protein